MSFWVILVATSQPAWQKAILKDFHALELDVNNDFLHGDLYEGVYMKVPPSSDQISSSCSQSSTPLFTNSRSPCYILSKNDYSLFTKSSDPSLVVLVVYVDDILLAGSDIFEMTTLETFLDDHFKIKDLGSVHYFLGLEITTHPSGYLMNQHKYTYDLLEEFNCSHFTPVSTPLDLAIKLTPDLGEPLSDPTTYKRLNGKLNFLQHTRPDVSFVVQHLSQFFNCPRVPHMLAGSCPVSWKIKKQPTISSSSAEAKYRALRKVVAEATLHIAKKYVFHERTKHIELDYHFVRVSDLISLHFVRSVDQLADILTKALPGPLHHSLLRKLAVLDPCSLRGDVNISPSPDVHPGPG
ncbi:uncharacterized mitochondrial protein AtMg00810-like [Lycium ferocissimum]|uniref:uncharacterized mitochondrial protein AtMg00810-like n=1 Tax=Lycium ferocissimum TaxID=112874 RepID=UPI002815EB37|nr:uncharacterized mitochondrial protein AtMg00810-like [Lycium ferocissimum]